MPIQDCDVLLHEAGAPPIHTPLSVLEELPERIKQRLYVVHTSDLPPGCTLRVAPTGTAGTIRLDQGLGPLDGHSPPRLLSVKRSHLLGGIDPATLDDGGNRSLSVFGDYTVPSFEDLGPSLERVGDVPPLVFIRPTDVSDAWFILNLLSNVPFFSSLSYANTMEVLEITKVEVFCSGATVVPSGRRAEVLCVVWEGTCIEQGSNDSPGALTKWPSSEHHVCVWHAGDWTGPVALQPDTERSAECATKNRLRDIVAASREGVKIILLQMNDLEKILRRGSKLYRKYLAVKQKHAAEEAAAIAKMRNEAMEGAVLRKNSTFDHVLEILKCNSVLSNLSALQKRSMESIAEGPRAFEADHSLWEVGARCDYAFLIVSGSATFGQPILPDTRRGMSVHKRRSSQGSVVDLGKGRYFELDKLLKEVPPDSEYARLEMLLSLRSDRLESDAEDCSRREMSMREMHRQSMQDRFANKVLARLYASRRYLNGLSMSRGCFLCDTSRMVSGELVDDLDVSQHHEFHCHS
jgi:hypothetical protein